MFLELFSSLVQDCLDIVQDKLQFYICPSNRILENIFILLAKRLDDGHDYKESTWEVVPFPAGRIFFWTSLKSFLSTEKFLCIVARFQSPNIVSFFYLTMQRITSMSFKDVFVSLALALMWNWWFQLGGMTIWIVYSEFSWRPYQVRSCWTSRFLGGLLTDHNWPVTITMMRPVERFAAAVAGSLRRKSGCFAPGTYN